MDNISLATTCIEPGASPTVSDLVISIEAQTYPFTEATMAVKPRFLDFEVPFSALTRFNLTALTTRRKLEEWRITARELDELHQIFESAKLGSERGVIDLFKLSFGLDSTIDWKASQESVAAYLEPKVREIVRQWEMGQPPANLFDIASALLVKEIDDLSRESTMELDLAQSGVVALSEDGTVVEEDNILESFVQLDLEQGGVLALSDDGTVVEEESAPEAQGNSGRQRAIIEEWSFDLLPQLSLADFVQQDIA